MLDLIRPTLEFKGSYLEVLNKRVENENYPADDYSLVNLAGQIERWRDLAKAPDKARYQYWVVADGRYIGTVQLRQEMSGSAPQLASHAYWGIDEPSMRTKDNEEALFALTLDEARELGFDELVVTCEDDNLARKTIIEAAGGILLEVVTAPSNVEVSKYHLKL